jgi:hypothetical protein
LALSFLLLPNWLEGFIGQLVQYPGYTEIGSPIWIVTRYYLPQLGQAADVGLRVVLLAFLFYQWRTELCGRLDPTGRQDLPGQPSPIPDP